MTKPEVEIGATYRAKVGGLVVSVRITGYSPYGGWTATSLFTGREIRIKTAARLRGKI